MKKPEESAVSTPDASPADLSTLVLGDATELTKDLNFFDQRFDVWVWGQWWPQPPDGGL